MVLPLLFLEAVAFPCVGCCDSCFFDGFLPFYTIDLGYRIGFVPVDFLPYFETCISHCGEKLVHPPVVVEGDNCAILFQSSFDFWYPVFGMDAVVVPFSEVVTDILPVFELGFEVCRDIVGRIGEHQIYRVLGNFRQEFSAVTVVDRVVFEVSGSPFLLPEVVDIGLVHQDFDCVLDFPDFGFVEAEPLVAFFFVIGSVFQEIFGLIDGGEERVGFVTVYFGVVERSASIRIHPVVDVRSSSITVKRRPSAIRLQPFCRFFVEGLVDCFFVVCFGEVVL